MSNPITDNLEDNEEPGLESVTLPGWLQDLRVLVGAGVTVGGSTIMLTDDPAAWARAVIIDWLLSGIISIIQQLVGLVIEIGEIMIDALVDAGSVILSPFRIVGETIIDLIVLLDSTIVSIAALGGPAAPLITVVVYAAVVYLAALGIRTLLEVVKWI